MVVLGVLSMTMSLAAAAAAAQYTVGDDGGWTINVNYTDWAVKQTFHEGDTIGEDRLDLLRSVTQLSRC